MAAEKLSRRTLAVVCTVAAVLCGTPAAAQTLAYTADDQTLLPSPAPPESDALPAALRRQVVSYPTTEAPGTIIIDTAHTFLYLTLPNGQALRYGIGVGREGFTWSGVETIARKSEWPDWVPPPQMIARQPYLPRWVGGGPGNPLGARALYLGNTDYRIHGTNSPGSIGKHVSSGCIRLLNADVSDLYNRVGIGTKVVVLRDDKTKIAPPLADGDERGVSIEARRSPPMGAGMNVRPDPVASFSPAPSSLY
jgi:lipoprotein-anchoring transpeptidase ErfK/SrfK